MRLSAYLLLADQTQRYKSYLRMRLQMHLNQTKTSYFVAAQVFTSADHLLAYQTQLADNSNTLCKQAES